MSTKQQTLIVFGHTHPEQSIANQRIVQDLQTRIPHAVVDDLMQLYPDFQIDVESEKQKLLDSDTVVVQSPVFWYSMPSILMRWFEEVFVHGWAYGSKGHALDGKQVVVGLTAGAANEDYEPGGRMGITPQEIVKPLLLLFQSCRMNFLGMVFTGGFLNVPNISAEDRQEREEAADVHATELVALLN